MPKSKNESKTIRAMSKFYGSSKRGTSIFYARVNKYRKRKGGGRWLKAIGRGAVNAASSGGRGRAYRARHPLRRRRSSSRRRR